MAEQILRTCYSFVIYNRDFSNALNDVNGDSFAQGNGDISVHVGTLHFTCKDVIRFFKGDMHPGDVYRDQRSLRRGNAFQRRSADSSDLRRRRNHRLRPVERPLVRHGRFGARVVRRHGERHVPRRDSDHARAPVRPRPLLPRRGASDRLQHPRSGVDHRRHAGAGGGDHGLRPGSPAPCRQIRQGHRRQRHGRRAGLCRARRAPADRRAAGRHLGDGRLHRPGYLAPGKA